MVTERIVLDNVSLNDLKKIDTNKNYSFVVYSKVSVVVLEFLNKFLANAPKAFLSFNCCIDNEKLSSYIYNLDVLKYLTNATHIYLFPKDHKTDLNSLDNLKYLDRLDEFLIQGVYKKTLDLTPILKFKDSITRIEVESGLTKKQQSIINQCTCLEILKVKELDLDSFDPKEKLLTLEVRSNLRQMCLVSTKFRNLESLRIQGCKSSLDIPALNTMISLKELDLFWIYQIDSFPNLTKLKNLTKLRCTLPNLQNLENLWKLKDLEYLEAISICEQKYLEPKDFAEIRDFKSLKKAYITWKDLQKHEEIKSLINNIGLEYKL